MTEDLALLADRIDALLETRDIAPSKALLAEMEHTLTDGYARALELEAARWRIEKDVTELAAQIATSSDAALLRSLSDRLARADRELGLLRTRLQLLRRRTDVVRGEIAAAAFAPAAADAAAR